MSNMRTSGKLSYKLAVLKRKHVEIQRKIDELIDDYSEEGTSRIDMSML